jgi:predicted O-methyltransferase YrrM
MEANVQSLLDEYHARLTAESVLMESLSSEEVGRRIEEFLIPVGPDTGALLHALVRSQGAKCVVEIGASYGYSAIWLADAVKQTGGKVHSFELSTEKIAFATAKLRSVGLHEYVEFHAGDVLEQMPRLQGPYDLVLIDCWKKLYVPCFELVYPKLAPAGIVVADNMLFPAATMPDAISYQKHVRSKRDMEAVVLPIGSGIDISRRRAEDFR